MMQNYIFADMKVYVENPVESTHESTKLKSELGKSAENKVGDKAGCFWTPATRNWGPELRNSTTHDGFGG